jgi:hypothetical protein
MLNKLAAAKVKTYRPEKRKRWLFRRMAGLLPQAQKGDWVRQRKKKKRVTWWTRADANLAVNLSRDFVYFPDRRAVFLGGMFSCFDFSIGPKYTERLERTLVTMIVISDPRFL